MKTNQLLEKRLDSITKKITKNIESSDLIASLSKVDLRGDLFAIEGALRIHLKNKSLNQKDMILTEKYLQIFKLFEDLLGAHGLKKELLNGNPKTKLPSKLKILNNKQLKSFISKNWNQEKISQLKIDLNKISWPNNSNKFLRKMLKNEIKRINKKTKRLKPLICSKKYTHVNLEEGFHEWRRGIRWISIYLQFYTNQIYLYPEKGHLSLYKKYKNNPFAQFKGSKKDIQLNKTQYLILSEFIEMIGLVKEKGELSIFAKVPYSDLEKDTSLIYEKFIESKVLKKLLRN